MIVTTMLPRHTVQNSMMLGFWGALLFVTLIKSNLAEKLAPQAPPWREASTPLVSGFLALLLLGPRGLQVALVVPLVGLGGGLRDPDGSDACTPR